MNPSHTNLSLKVCFLGNSTCSSDFVSRFRIWDNDMYINEERIIKQNVNNWWLWMRILCTILASFLSVCSMMLKLLRFQTHDTLNHHEALKPYQLFIFYD